MKKLVSCTALLALAVLALAPSAARAGMTADKACSLEKLKASGKALQCRLTALGTWVSKPDLRAWEKSVGQCRSKMADAFGNAERRYGVDACASSADRKSTRLNSSHSSVSRMPSSA